MAIRLCHTPSWGEEVGGGLRLRLYMVQIYHDYIGISCQHIDRCTTLRFLHLLVNTIRLLCVMGCPWFDT